MTDRNYPHSEYCDIFDYTAELGERRKPCNCYLADIARLESSLQAMETKLRQQESLREAYCETLRHEYAEKYRQLREEFERQRTELETKLRNSEFQLEQAKLRLDFVGRAAKDVVKEKAELETKLREAEQRNLHRACCGVEHDPSNGKIHGCCVVCVTPWPCQYCEPEKRISELETRAQQAEQRFRSTLAKIWNATSDDIVETFISNTLGSEVLFEELAKLKSEGSVDTNSSTG